MTLEVALVGLTAAKRNRCRDKLVLLSKSSALGLQAANNIECECRLPPAAWRQIARNLNSCGLTAIEVKTAVMMALRQFTLVGPVSTSGVTVYGRAITVDRFCRMLCDFGYYPDLNAARISLRRMLIRSAAQVAHWWRHFRLGQHLMWATFDNELDGEGFLGSASNADEIRAMLGLDINERGLPLLLLEYDLPHSIVSRIPTIADAYSGLGWPYFFRPAPPKAPHGLTLPWPSHQNKPPRPEVVHAVILGSQLKSLEVIP